MLKRIKIDIQDIRDAIVSAKDDRLSVDELQFISKQLPTPEEVVRLKEFKDPEQLAIADRYFCEVLAISYPARSRC